MNQGLCQHYFCILSYDDKAVKKECLLKAYLYFMLNQAMLVYCFLLPFKGGLGHELYVTDIDKVVQTCKMIGKE